MGLGLGLAYQAAVGRYVRSDGVAAGELERRDALELRE